MMNTPTNRAMKAKAVRKVLKNPRLFSSSALLSAVSAAPVTTS